MGLAQYINNGLRQLTHVALEMNLHSILKQRWSECHIDDAWWNLALAHR
jgi:hypothetical protein